MPIHDWSKTGAGLFHHFHQDWSIEIVKALNCGHLPAGYSALVEQPAAGKEPDVLAIESLAEPRDRYEVASANGQNQGDTPDSSENSSENNSGQLSSIEPVTRMTFRAHWENFHVRANRIVIRHPLGRVVSVIEIVSPGNKDRQRSLQEFVEKAIQFLRSSVHLLVIDLFPPKALDPHGLHSLIWRDFADCPLILPTNQNRLLMSYRVGDDLVAYLEPIGIGDCLPAMPLFLTPEAHIRVPLEPTYETSWNLLPEMMRLKVAGDAGDR